MATGFTALIVAAASACVLSGSAAAASPGRETFVGTSPCGAMVREFLEGIPPGAPCDAVTWRLALVKNSGATSTFELAAGYEIPVPGRPGHMQPGPQVTLKGAWEVVERPHSPATTRTYRLWTGKPERSLELTLVGDDLLHLLTADKRLLQGTGGWSYTLNRAERAEGVTSDAPPPDLSYVISPRATGPVFGVFEGRTPCHGIARVLNLQTTPGCFKVKWRLTLFQDPQSSAPSTYKVEGTLHRTRAREGTWSVVHGPAGSADVYRLSPTDTEAALLLMRGDDDVLFFLDQQQRLMIGNGDFSYTLNRRTP